MKIIQYSILSLLFSALIFSCNKEPDSSTPITFKDEIIEVDFNGAPFKEYCGYAPGGLYHFRLEAAQSFVGSVEYKFYIQFTSDPTTGTHSIDGNDYFVRLNLWDSSTSTNNSYESVSGTIKISSYKPTTISDGYIEGTFDAILENTNDPTDKVYCTNGKFYGIL